MKNFNIENIQGVDADIETSIHEYGLAWIESNDKKEVLFWYGIGVKDDGYFNKFDFCSFPVDLDIKSEFDWIEDDWTHVYIFVGLSEQEFHSRDLSDKIYDLFQYFGSENIFGSTYHAGFSFNGTDFVSL